MTLLADAHPMTGVPRHRVPQWVYLGPIVAAPLAHMLVSAMRRHPQYKRPLAWGVVAATVGAVVTRVALMGHAGYPGGEGEKYDRVDG